MAANAPTRHSVTSADAGPAGRAGSQRPESAGPVVLLSYGHSGADVLLKRLSENAGLACTSGTGILPLCQAAAETWRRVEGTSEGALSRLAIASVRSQAAALVTTILAGSGRTRWCEFATSVADTAQDFLLLFPATKFLCVHRACTGMLAAAAAAHPWSLAGPEFGSFPSLYPANRAAALAAYWASFTERLLAFEDAHPDSCLRVRYEDLVAAENDTMTAILGHLGIAELTGAPAGPPGSAEADSSADASPGNGTTVPVSELPAPLAGRIDGLLRRLGYPALPRA